MPSPEPYRYSDDTPRPLPHWIDRDDLDQVAAVARLEALAVGDDPDDAAADAVAEFLETERWRQAKESPASSRFRAPDEAGNTDRAMLGWVSDAARVRSIAPPPAQTPGQKRRFLRNQVILAASLAGFSERTLANVFDLPHSRINAILAEMRARTGRG